MSGTGYKTTGFRDGIGVFSPDRLVVGDTELLRHVEADLRIGSAVTLLRGTLMGRVRGASAVRAAPGNTGGTTFAAAASSSAALEAREGRYTVRCTTAGNAGAARYTIYDPEGDQWATGLASGTGTATDGITVTPTHASPDPVVGDTWTFRVHAAYWQRVDPKSIRGAAVAAGVLVQEVMGADGSAISGDTGYNTLKGHVYTQGVFDWNCVSLATEGRTEIEETVVFDHGYELADVKGRLAENGLILLDSIQERADPLETSTNRANWL